MRHRFVPLIALLSATVVGVPGLAGCMSTHPPLGMPDDTVIGFTSDDGGRAIPPRCDQLNQPSHMNDAGRRRPGVAFGCATYSNLAAMLARPADLVAPVPYAGADAALGASAVRAYEEGRAQPLRSTSTTTSVSH
jgi:pilus assembly protein CpaD